MSGERQAASCTKFMTEADYNPGMLTKIALNGNAMKRKEVEFLAKELELDENQIVPRIKLLGYYFTRYLTKMADNAFLAHPFAIILKDVDLDNSDYEDFKQLWISKIEENPTSISILLNAATAISFSDLELAVGIVNKARLLAPEDEGLQKLSEDILRRRSRTN
jgi:hypothetical protein